MNERVGECVDKQLFPQLCQSLKLNKRALCYWLWQVNLSVYLKVEPLWLNQYVPMTMRYG